MRFRGETGALSLDDGYAKLRRAIVEGRFLPNQRLVEADLVAELAVSRAAVRTALVRLVQEGLVEHERNRGAKVRLVGEAEAVEILETRAVLEGLAARKAAERASDTDIAALRDVLASMRARLEERDYLGASDRNAALHATLLEIAGHSTVVRVLSSLNGQLVRFQYRTMMLPGRSGRSLAEHTAIVEAVARRDPDGAEAAMRGHLSNVTEALRSARTAVDSRQYSR